MAIIVQKYGGSSVASPEKIKQVARRVMESQKLGHQVVVVVSAMGNTTNDFLALARQVSESPERRELDMLLTAGERISVALLSIAIRDLGGQSISFTGSQAGIITNDRHVDARIIEVRPVRIQDELERGNIVIVAGYQGMSYRREITTLGRGGSDTTAVALAAALDAEWCEICSDVDGVYTTDPRIVPAAKRIPEMSYEETQEMAEAGAKVLHAQAVEFAKEKGIAIYARLTAGPLPGIDPTLDGTVIRKCPPRAPGTVTGVASEKAVYLLRAEVPELGPLLECLDELEVGGKQLHAVHGPGGLQMMTMVVPSQNLHHFAQVSDELNARFGNSVCFLRDFGAVSVIGAGINASHANLLRGQKALGETEAREVFTSSFRITWVVPSASVEEVVRRLHAEFLEAASYAVPPEW